MYISEAEVSIFGLVFTWVRRLVWRASELQRNTVMTIEILHLTAQIQNWLNVQVARHLAAQAAKLSH